MNIRNQKFWIVILAVVLLASFSAILFHHHEHADEDHSQNCSACRLAQQVLCVFSLFVTGLLLTRPKAERYFETSEKLFSRLFASDLSGRAPPFANAKGLSIEI